MAQAGRQQVGGRALALPVEVSPQHCPLATFLSRTVRMTPAPSPKRPQSSTGSWVDVRPSDLERSWGGTPFPTESHPGCSPPAKGAFLANARRPETLIPWPGGKWSRPYQAATIWQGVDVVADGTVRKPYPPCGPRRQGRLTDCVRRHSTGRRGHPDRVGLGSARLDLTDFARRPGEVDAGRDVLDHQLVDVDGVQVSGPPTCTGVGAKPSVPNPGVPNPVCPNPSVPNPGVAKPRCDSPGLPTTGRTSPRISSIGRRDVSAQSLLRRLGPKTR